MRHYLVSGLVLAPDVDLPFAASVTPRGEPQITIHRGDVPGALDGATASGAFWELAERRFLFSVPGVVRCLVSDEREITYQPEPAVDPADTVPFVMGTGFGVLLQQRGLFVLQASSVEVDGQAILICGRSAAGKSVMAAALAERGFPIVADDMCVVDFDPVGAPGVRPEGRYTALWGRAVDALELGDRRRQALRSTIEKFYVEARAVTASARLPVLAVYRLRSTRAGEPASISASDGVQAASTLRRNSYRSRFIQAAGREVSHFEDVTRLAARAGVFELRLPMDFRVLPDAVTSLVSHARSLLPAEAAP